VLFPSRLLLLEVNYDLEMELFFEKTGSSVGSRFGYSGEGIHRRITGKLLNLYYISAEYIIGNYKLILLKPFNKRPGIGRLNIGHEHCENIILIPIGSGLF